MIELRNLNKTFHTQDGALTALDDINLTVQDGEIFDDALLHLFQTEMVGVQNRFRLFQALRILRIDAEGQFLDPVDVIEDHRIVR